MNTTIIIKDNNKNINNQYNTFKDLLLRFKTYLNDNIKQLQERLTTDIDRINNDIRIHIDEIIKLIDKFNKMHNNNIIYKTNGLNDYKNSLDKYKSKLESSVKNNFFTKLLANIEKKLNSSTNIHIGTNGSNIINKITTNESTTNKGFESTRSEGSRNNTNERSGIDTSKELNEALKINDIISWTDRNKINKYGKIIGPPTNGNPRKKKVQVITLNNNNNIFNTGRTLDKNIISSNGIGGITKIGTYNPESKKLIRSINS